MSVKLETFDTSTVSSITDARLYEFLTQKQAGVVEGVDITTTGGLGLHITSGWGVILGRVFTVNAEDIIVNPSLQGTQNGRLILQIDISNNSEPIKFITQSASYLPFLQQEEINKNGTIYQLELATYNVSEVSLSSLSIKTNRISSGISLDEIKRIERIANNAMPKIGGTFTGQVVASDEIVTGYAMRNSWVGTSNLSSDAQPSQYIWFQI